MLITEKFYLLAHRPHHAQATTALTLCENAPFGNRRYGGQITIVCDLDQYLRRTQFNNDTNVFRFRMVYCVCDKFRENDGDVVDSMFLVPSRKRHLDPR